MPTNPPTGLLDRHMAKAAAREWIDIATPMLVEVVNHGVAAFARCSKTAKGGDEHLAILMPYIHLLEMIDGVQILLVEVAPAPAQLELRTAFETLLTIEYITEGDTIRRAYAYLVADIQRRLTTYRGMDPKTAEGRRKQERIATDSYAREMQVPDIPDLAARIENLKELLAKPRWRDADTEYQATKKRLKGRRPQWHQLYGGPENLEALATHLNRPAQYDYLYRHWSQTVHAGDAVYRKLTKGTEGGPAVRRIRDISEFKTVGNLAAYFGMEATRRILSFYRPEEIPAFNKWYVREIRESYLKFVGPKSE